ncbi:uncharacterized protein [Chironomus tepperi]|uniref:uncharacterized protein n=1 Tax=Chironomus tepperi TaxID=113505 RepID=UPI00391EE4F5
MFINLYSTNIRCLVLRSIFNRNISTALVRMTNSKNFYEILELKQDCTQKDIKEQFVNLSRQHHPDMKDDCDCDKEFKKILEAYQVLSKPHSRANYDLALQGIHTVNYVTNDVVHRPFEENDKRWTSPNADTGYYGVKGIKKVANWKIVLACLIFCATGIIAQVFAISKSFTFKRDKLREQTIAYNEMHKKTRSEALKNDNLTNLQNMLNRMKEKDEK